MKTRHVLSALTLGVVTVALLPAAAQRPARTTSLTADDHMQIQQLVMRFGYAVHTGANDGAMFADLFMEDGIYGEAKGRSQLAAVARTRPDGESYRHFVTNVMVRPTERGAAGTQYEVMFAVGQNGNQSTIARTGRYEDAYMKTSAGWRIQKRDYFPSLSTTEADKAAVPQARRLAARSRP